MAQYYGTTVSQGGKIKKGSEKEINKIINDYTFGQESELIIEIVDEELHIYGNDSSYAYLKSDEDRDQEIFDDFLKRITPFLTTPLIVSEVGSEKCRYVLAWAYIAKPNKEVVCISLQDAIDKALKH